MGNHDPKNDLPLEALTLLCRQHGVRAMYLFGSAVNGRFNTTKSDYDFIVDFGDADLGPWARRLVALRQDLARTLGRPVDLVTLEAIRSSPAWSRVNEEKVPVYAAA